MNKKEINRLLPIAYDVLEQTEIADTNHKIVKTYRGYISTFGAAVSGGSLLAAIAFFTDQGEADFDRPKLMKALYQLVEPEEQNRIGQDFFTFIRGKIQQGRQIAAEEEAVWKEKTINAAIALKLAMNLYTLVKNEEKR